MAPKSVSDSRDKMPVPSPMPELNMNPEPNSISRRDALKCALQGALVTAALIPAVADASTSEPAPTRPPVFIPENDYPFFGGEVPEAYRFDSGYGPGTWVTD